MERIPEPELMDDEAQAQAYAAADFSEPHAMFVQLCVEAWSGCDLDGALLDLGCGPADVTARLALAFPRLRVDAIDGSEPMLRHGRERVEGAGLAPRVRLWNLRLPAEADQLPQRGYAAIVSNSLLHHLADPAVLWRTVRVAGRSGTLVFVMDLLRPASPREAASLVERNAATEPEILRRDFHASLCAAYRIGEVRDQLVVAGLDGFSVRAVSDRHLAVSGILP